MTKIIETHNCKLLFTFYIQSNENVNIDKNILSKFIISFVVLLNKKKLIKS